MLFALVSMLPPSSSARRTSFGTLSDWTCALIMKRTTLSANQVTITTSVHLAIRFHGTSRGAEGSVAYVTLALTGDASLADAHGQASAVEERVRAAVPEVADVVVHTEP